MNVWKASASLISDIKAEAVAPAGDVSAVATASSILNLYYLFSTSAIFIARTLSGNPKRLINPSASWWS